MEFWYFPACQESFAGYSVPTMYRISSQPLYILDAQNG